MQVANAAYTQSAAVKPFKEGEVEWVKGGWVAFLA